MKFKDKRNDDLIDEYNSIRFNPNVIGYGRIISREASEEKKDFAIASILSLMSMCGYYDEIVRDNSNLSEMDVVKKMINNAKEKIEQYNHESQELRGRL
ncbi:MAG: hypothetical protein ACI33S_00890 [Bacilli bacterium]